MEPVLLRVTDVVEQVAGRRRQAERDDRDEHARPRVAVGQRPRGGGGGQDQHVLEPLAGAHRRDEASEEPGRGGP
jgi:hypothetical protein